MCAVGLFTTYHVLDSAHTCNLMDTVGLRDMTQRRFRPVGPSVNITENGPGRAQRKLQWAGPGLGRTFASMGRAGPTGMVGWAGPGLGREFLEWAGPGRNFSAHFEPWSSVSSTRRRTTPLCPGVPWAPLTGSPMSLPTPLRDLWSAWRSPFLPVRRTRERTHCPYLRDRLWTLLLMTFSIWICGD